MTDCEKTMSLKFNAIFCNPVQANVQWLDAEPENTDTMSWV